MKDASILFAELTGITITTIMLILPFTTLAQDAICASVRMQVSQELTLERQAFDAMMRIHNGFDQASLTNVSITVAFKDEDQNSVLASEDPDNTNALFYIQTDSVTNITSTTNGVVDPSKTAEIRWLIIPNPGAADADPQGTLYFVGATLSYTLLNEDHTTEVTPDYIYVKPMPDLALDYFLPGQVYGDDAFTEESEPSIPFPLGLRVKNLGSGTANDLQIDSGEPKIIENDQGLLVGFNIESTEMHGQTVTDSLLIDYGTLPSAESKIARWLMTVTLSGTFTNFTAQLSHADELGGQLTSLIDETNVNTHIHIKDVLVDLTGRDTVNDFLTDAMMLYESEGIDTCVTNMSSASALSGSSGSYTLNLTNPPATGYVFSKLTNPEGTNMMLSEVVRSDGKRVRTENAWLSKSRDGTNAWEYWFNFFDANVSNFTYSVVYEAGTNANQAPTLAYLIDRTGYAGTNIGFAVYASDDAGAPDLTTSTLPANANFTDYGDGTGRFSWTPSTNQVGTYAIRFTADDGELNDSETVTLTVKADTTAYPNWWLTRSVLDANATVRDYGAAVMGQVKHLAAQAWNELDDLPGGAGFALDFTNDYNYAAVNVGQLKSLATNFYDRLSKSYPWAGSTNIRDYAIANIGQVKNLFQSITPHQDTDTDGLPDWWEEKYSLDPADGADATQDANTNGVSNLLEFFQDQNPTS